MRNFCMTKYRFVLMFICITFSYANTLAQQVSIKIIVKDNEEQLLPNASLSINEKKVNLKKLNADLIEKFATQPTSNKKS